MHHLIETSMALYNASKHPLHISSFNPMDEEKILSSHFTLEETEADGDEEPAHGTCLGGSHPQI